MKSQKDSIVSGQHINTIITIIIGQEIKNMKEFKQLMEEVGFQISKLNDGTIDKNDFVQAINEIHEHFNTTII